MIDTLNPEAPATPVTAEVAESAAVPAERRQHSPERLEDRARCNHRYPNSRRRTLPGRFSAWQG